MAESDIEIKFIVSVGEVSRSTEQKRNVRRVMHAFLPCYGRATSAAVERLNYSPWTAGSLLT